MDFGRQDVSAPSDVESLKRDLNSIILSFFKKDRLDPHNLYQEIKDKVGLDNIDDSMLNFAINSAIDQINKAKEIDKPLAGTDLQRQVDLIVNWALIKIKGREDGSGEIQFGNNKPSDDEYGAGGDQVVLKDFVSK